MAPSVHTPVKGFTGTVAGVNFADGVGETDDPAALLYFGSAGYDITEEEPPAGTPMTPEELEWVAQHEAATGGSATPSVTSEPVAPEPIAPEPVTSESVTPEAVPVAEGSDAKPERPHPVQGNMAAWFEYLTAIKPDHGFDLETAKRKDLILAANVVDGTDAE